MHVATCVFVVVGRRVALVVSLASISLLSFGLAATSLASDVPKDKSAFTSYMQNKLQLYSPLPINFVGPLSLSVGTSSAAVRLPSLVPLHKHCMASPSKCDAAVNDYVQSVTRSFLQKPTTATPGPTQPPASLEKPSCAYVDGPNANPHDQCAPARVDWQNSPPLTTPGGVCSSGQEGVVIVSFTVHADGSASDAAVVVSSDIRRLDDSAVSQVISQHYFPATKNGSPIDTPPKSVKTMFQFSCSEFGSFAPSQTHPPANPDFRDKLTCLQVDGPNADPRDKCAPARIDWRHTVQVPFQFVPTKGGDIQDAIVDFAVHEDGSVSDVTVTRSSGFQTFDTSAVARIAARHYFPATKNGTPIAIHIRSAVGVCILTSCKPSETPLPDDLSK
jgi:TonB family protein